jgi:ACS family hexuronate transporter-like MFS transporter
MRYAALVCVVVLINLTWHYFRAWLPKYLQEFQKYNREEVNFFSAAYYAATDAGCIAAGYAVQRLQRRGRTVHQARLRVFGACAALTMAAVVTAHLPRGALLLGGLLVIGAGSLGLFPIYYSCSQELSTRNQGKITGSLSAITWVVTAIMHEVIGRVVDAYKSHAAIMTLAGLLPLAALLALVLLWREQAVPPGAR